MIKKTTFPAIIISLILTISFGVLSIGHVLTNKPLNYLDYGKSFGLDYIDFFRASENILHKLSPYDISDNRYVTTPIPALFNIVFVPLGFNVSRFLIYGLIAISLAIGFYLIATQYNFSKINKNIVLLTGLVCLLFGYPFYFLIQRENIDGWVFLFLCLGLYLSQKEKKEFWSGLFLSLAIAFKIYPILIILPFLIYKKWRLLFWIGLWLVIWGGISSFWFSDLRNAIVMRSQSIFRFDENGSLVATVALISILANALGMATTSFYTYSPTIVALLYGILFSLVIFTDYKLSKKNKYELSSVIMYLPFMIALPQTVYHYSFVLCLILIPMTCHLWEADGNDKSRRIILTIMAFSISLSQWQAIATYNLTNNMLSHVIPGLGLLIIMVSIVIYKFLSLRSSENVEASKDSLNKLIVNN